MDFIAAEIQAYSQAHTQEESAILKKINRETHAEVLLPRMLSGHLQGRVLSMLSKMIRPKTVLEIGTYTGYSAICFAEGLAEGGMVITLDINEELEDRVRGYFQESGYGNVIDYRIGDAKTMIPEINESLDLVFIDADKAGYAQYYELCLPKVRSGGFIIADNVLWSGKVAQPENAAKDKDLANMLAFNKMVNDDPRVDNLLLPVRDGLMIAVKK